jgi:pyridoxamine 5'-phosphate oxidase
VNSPFQQFSEWMQEAEAQSGMNFPNAMTLATADASGRPSARIVLLKRFSEEGFVFFTNYESRKGRELTQRPEAALCFYWDQISRQVRVEGKVEKLPPTESAAYFHTRPRLSQIGAWASEQSREIPSRDYLEHRVAEVEKRYEGKTVPLPPFWGGFLLRPERFEFWQMRQGRLHDRLVFEPGSRGWRTAVLAP